jgi:hypothetical protein
MNALLDFTRKPQLVAESFGPDAAGESLGGSGGGLLLHEGGKLVPFFQGHVLLGPVVVRPDAEEDFAEEMAVVGRERRAIEDDGFAAMVNMLGEKRFQFSCEIALVLFRQLAEPQEGGTERGGIFFFQEREQCVANPVPGISGGGVAGIFAAGLRERGEIGQNIGAVHREERPQQGDSGRKLSGSGNSGKTADAGAPEDAVQHGFHLVVGSMCGHDKARADPVSRFGQKVVPGRASSRLQAVASGVGRLTAAADFERDVQVLGELADESLVGVRFCSPQVVIEMGGENAAFAGRSFQLHQAPEQGHAIRTAGNGDEGGYVLPGRGRESGGELGEEGGHGQSGCSCRRLCYHTEYRGGGNVASPRDYRVHVLENHEVRAGRLEE